MIEILIAVLATFLILGSMAAVIYFSGQVRKK